MRIAVCGSTIMRDPAVQEAACQLGTAIGARKHDVAFGLFAGLPYAVASAARKAGSRVIGFAPYAASEAENLAGHLGRRIDPEGIVDETVYLPGDLGHISGQTQAKIRNMLMVGSADAAVVVSGAWGTVTEFGLARSSGMPVGLLRNSGGAADALPALVQALEGGENPGNIVVTDDPAAMIEELQRLLAAVLVCKACADDEEF